ncbi:hypothetical protein E3E14_18440 [Streptomyces sp. ICN441]|uniref:Uncharacterized protein n=1 Tax=Streptomyces tirandamycinicus TaxID=2174846 RepID=A0A2S1STE0_9ACTN|nr:MULTISPECIES: hypothetical protein [Streptomyces]AWI29671.1 hypothetical protein DDW44_13390 [Streptomyces tirandamycinicus]TFE48079.1 hypothetical protein E3E14_18440 [Streptomyces sp. ICN441]
MKETRAAEGVWARATHATPLKRDATYDRRARQAALDIEIHHTDGHTITSVLVLTPDQVELYAIQFEQLIAKREQARREGR